MSDVPVTATDDGYDILNDIVVDAVQRGQEDGWHEDDVALLVTEDLSAKGFVVVPATEWDRAQAIVTAAERLPGGHMSYCVAASHSGCCGAECECGLDALRAALAAGGEQE